MRPFANAILIVLLAVLSTTLKAQHKKYTLSGVVYDSITGLPVSDPHVSIAGTKYKAIGSEKGYYKIQKLIPGTNNLVVWADGYDSAIIRFEIRKNMKLNVKLMQILDTASLHIADEETPTKDTAVATIKEAPPAKVQPKPTKKKKKSKKTDLTEKEKEEIKVLIEDVIFSKAIFFERFKNKRRSVYVKGSFTIDTGYLYTFKAKFSKKSGFELKWLDFEMKGKHSQ
jgi:hypothetical protein